MNAPRRKYRGDPRVKRRTFSWMRFFGVFAVLMLLAIGQSLMLADGFGAGDLPPEMLNTLIIYWACVAGLYSLLTTLNIRLKYEQPMQQLSRATKQVAEGDFSARLKPQHPADRSTYLDVMCLDFNKMVEELSSIEILKNDFISNVSHEIKTPLAVIQNYSTLLQSAGLTDAQRMEYTDVIISAADQLGSLVTNILRLGKLENQTIQPAKRPYDLCRQLGDCVLGFADRMEAKPVEFSADIEDRALVLADESTMEIVWNNLLSNAIKFTEPGGKISLTERSDSDGVLVSISDTGCGMDEDTLKHIFDKFYQGDTSHSQEGCGLGLALVRRILELNGGSIEVKSAPGEGSVFTVRLSKPPQ